MISHNSPLTHGPCAHKCGTCVQGIRPLGTAKGYYCQTCGHAGCKQDAALRGENGPVGPIGPEGEDGTRWGREAHRNKDAALRGENGPVGPIGPEGEGGTRWGREAHRNKGEQA